nr:hypothetical protein GCM10020093_105820 [Planobispora longispora]
MQIDPIDLHSFVRQRLLEMRDAVPSAPERVARLHINDHLAVRGPSPGSTGSAPRPPRTGAARATR